MNNLLEIYSPPKLNQEDKDQLNRPLTRNEIEYVIKKKKKQLPTNKRPRPEFTSQANSTKHTKTSFLNFSKRLKKKE